MSNRVEFLKDASGDWRWRYVSGNNRIMATSGEGYKNREDCINSCQIVLDAYLGTLGDVAGETVEVLTPMATRMPLMVEWVDRPEKDEPPEKPQ